MSEEYKELKEKLLMKKENGYDLLSAEERTKMEEYCRAYRHFLDVGRTERLCTKEAVRMAKEAGFVEYTRDCEVKAGAKFYRVNRKKGVMLVYVGKQPLACGMQIAGAHIDSPRLDLKPNPLYEEQELAMFKTHYYGGIRKYQWLSIPLSIHGVVFLADGTEVEISVGDKPDEPKFIINDLLPHLGHQQDTKPLGSAVKGESLNVLIGSRPIADVSESDRVKLGIMKLLHEKYGITEADFQTTELEIVPAEASCEIGFDRSLLGSYGHDDRSCAFAALKGILDLAETPERTAFCILTDKEETGSDGVTGMQGAFFDMFAEDLCAAQDTPARICLEHSFCLSADVTAAYDPNYDDVYEKRNAAYLNYGISICKYTGSRGKSGASDASAETVSYIRSLFQQNDVIWQIDELGKVDIGGGGTIAKYMANRNIDTIDAGVPVLAMHAPFECVSKVDCYETYKGMQAVYRAVK